MNTKLLLCLVLSVGISGCQSNPDLATAFENINKIVLQQNSASVSATSTDSINTSPSSKDAIAMPGDRRIAKPSAPAPTSIQKPSTSTAKSQPASDIKNSEKQPDWTKLFKSWENGCKNSPEIDALIRNLVTFSNDGKVKLEKVDLPTSYKNATGIPIIKTPTQIKDNYYTITIPVLNGTYYEIPVKAIERYFGDENGLSGAILHLNASTKDARLALSKQKVQFRKKEDLQAQLNGDTKVSEVTCDWSD